MHLARRNPRLFPQNSLLHSLEYWGARSVGLLTGSSGIFTLSGLWQVNFALSGCRVWVIDCAMRHDIFALADEAARNQANTDELLANIMVKRVFTPYQILSAICDIIHLPVSVSGRDIYFLLAPCKQFFDGDVQRDEGAFLLRKLTGLLNRIKTSGIPLLIVEKNNYRHASFVSAFTGFKQLASPIWELKVTETEFKKKYNMQISKHQGTLNGTNSTALFHPNRLVG